ncbi:MAG: HAD-IIIA family hydrolase [Candidatus Zixiibacteriota bacterium]
MQSRTLVIRFGSLGDVVLTSATVVNLKLAHPDSRIVYLTRERFRPLVDLFFGVDTVETVPDRITVRTLFEMLLNIEGSGFEQVVDLHGNLRSWFARSVLRTNSIYTYPKRRWERWVLTRRKKTLPSEYPHTIDLYNDVLIRQDKRAPCDRPLMAAPPLAPDLAAVVDTGRPVVLIAPGAAHPTKAWPVERFAEVARQLQVAKSVSIVWAVTSSERSAYGAPNDLRQRGLTELVDCPLDQLAAIVSRVALVICNDSGVGHIGSAVGTPVLALFGPTHPVLGFAPRGLRDRIMQVDEFCRPCSRHGKKPCWREERYCFTKLTSESVAGVAVEMLDETARLTPCLFVDRDGTLIHNKHYLADPEGVELIDGVPEALRQARQLGYKVVVVSNQSGVARGLHTIDDVERVNARVREQLRDRGADFDAIYYCPHHSSKSRPASMNQSCRCRKPSPGMAEQAALELGLDLRRSVVIGDSVPDIALARVIGARPILVRTGYGATVETRRPDRLRGFGVDVADDLAAAVRLLLQGETALS